MAWIIRRGLRALGDLKFPMPSNTVGIARMRRELFVDVVETMPPRKKKLVQNMFLTNFFGGGGHYCADSSGWYLAVAENSQGSMPKMAPPGLKPHLMIVILLGFLEIIVGTITIRPSPFICF